MYGTRCPPLVTLYTLQSPLYSSDVSQAHVADEGIHISVSSPYAANV